MQEAAGAMTDGSEIKRVIYRTVKNKEKNFEKSIDIKKL